MHSLAVDVIVYSTRIVYCTGERYTFSCSEPNLVMWIGESVVWGYKPAVSSVDEGCVPGDADCRLEETGSSFVNVRTSLYTCYMPYALCYMLFCRARFDSDGLTVANIATH